MSTSVVHVLKVTGPSSREADAFLRGMTARQLADSASARLQAASVDVAAELLSTSTENLVAAPIEQQAMILKGWCRGAHGARLPLDPGEFVPLTGKRETGPQERPVSQNVDVGDLDGT